MGADYTAVSVIGICLPDEDSLPRAKKSIRKKAFDHNFNEEDAEFHPKTGKKLWLDEKEEIEADYPVFVFDLDGSLDIEELEEGQQIIKLVDNDNEEDINLECTSSTDDEIYYGLVLETESSNEGDPINFCKIPNIESIKNKIKEKLEPFGLWNEENFGLYSILYCSY